VHIEIWSDVACPWCYVGKRRFEAALARFAHRDEVTVEWRSFELDPAAPARREESLAEHLAAKYGTSLERAREMEAQMTQVAAAEGLDFHFERGVGANMLDAHRTIHLAKAHGRQDAMEERLFKAYLEEGEVLSDHATLRRLAAEVGLDDAEVAETLATGRFEQEVRDDERTAQQLGINAVPCFVVDRRFAAQGAQDPEALLQLLDHAWAQRAPALQAVPDGAACGPDGC
jgi:predicted DsbA family dithiol-disulfide isomerase